MLYILFSDSFEDLFLKMTSTNSMASTSRLTTTKTFPCDRSKPSNVDAGRRRVIFTTKNNKETSKTHVTARVTVQTSLTGNFNDLFKMSQILAESEGTF